MNLIFGTCLFILCIFWNTSAFAQLDKSRLELGISAGISIYQGDLTPSPIGSYRTPGFNLNLFGGYRLNPKVSLRGHLALGSLRGDDAAYTSPEWRTHRAFAFQSPIAEFSAQAVYQPLGFEKKLSPYFFAGAGLAYLRTRSTSTSFDPDYFGSEPGLSAAIQQDVAHGPPGLLPVVPIGAGLQYRLSPAISLTAETNYRLTASDYIDGFSVSANPSKNDHYLTHSLGILYRFRKKSALDCPDSRSMNKW